MIYIFNTTRGIKVFSNKEELCRQLYQNRYKWLMYYEDDEREFKDNLHDAMEYDLEITGEAMTQKDIEEYFFLYVFEDEPSRYGVDDIVELTDENLTELGYVKINKGK